MRLLDNQGRKNSAQRSIVRSPFQALHQQLWQANLRAASNRLENDARPKQNHTNTGQHRNARSPLVAMPGAPSSFLFLVAMPGTPSSVLAPSNARSP